MGLAAKGSLGISDDTFVNKNWSNKTIRLATMDYKIKLNKKQLKSDKPHHPENPFK